MIESAPDFLNSLSEVLVLVATSLDAWLRIPWPIPVAVLFFPTMAVLQVVVWWVRGTMLPLPCSYPVLEGRRRGCLIPTVGERHRCWYHGKAGELRTTDSHFIDPSRPRWETLNRFGKWEEDKSKSGAGFLFLWSSRRGLLYYKGYVRRPGMVWNALPGLLKEHFQRARDQIRDLRELGWRAIFLPKPSEHLVGVSRSAASVVSATQWVLMLIAFALGMIFIATLEFGWVAVRVWCEYLSSSSLIIALAVARAGIWEGKIKWRQAAFKDSLRWLITLTALALVAGSVTLYSQEIEHQFEATVKTIADLIGSGVILLIAASLLFGGRSRTGRRSYSKSKKGPRRRPNRRRW